jgi:ubiquinone/menaquinone biosynthesis C-methylase UbiE
MIHAAMPARFDRRVVFAVTAALAIAPELSPAPAAHSAAQPAPPAQQRDAKQYQQVLENPDRVAALQVDKVIAMLGVAGGTRVADLGAGSGIFTIPLARMVGPRGIVYAVDIDPALLAIVADKAKAAGLTNVRTIVAGENASRIPEPVDVIFICDTMHHLPNQAAYVKQFPKLLRQGGRVAVIDFAEGKWPAGHESFTITPPQVDVWMTGAGLTLAASYDFLETNFLRVYRR